MAVDTGNIAGSDDVGTVDESGSQEIFTDKLKDLIDGISAKRLSNGFFNNLMLLWNFNKF